jgi:hypothetical protein
MARLHAILLLLALRGASAQTLTVCELLAHLDDLNGKEVRVRGTWTIGDTGEFLESSVGCESHTVRDGWMWKDFIYVMPLNKDAEHFRSEHYRLKTENYDKPVKIVATVAGRFETRDHFEVRGRAVGPYKYCVGMVWYQGVEEINVLPYDDDERERQWEMARHPYPERVKMNKQTARSPQ